MLASDLYQLHSEVQKLQTYVGGARPIEARDVDILILRSEQFGPFELDDALLARDYKKAVQVIGTMLDEGVEPLMVLSRVVRVWRQLFVGKSLVGKEALKTLQRRRGARSGKRRNSPPHANNSNGRQLAAGFRLLLGADRAFKTSTPNPEGYFDVMLWKMIGLSCRLRRRKWPLTCVSSARAMLVAGPCAVPS